MEFGIEPSGVALGEMATCAGGRLGSVWVLSLRAPTVASATVPSLAAWDSRAPLSSSGSQAPSRGCFESALVRRMACALLSEGGCEVPWFYKSYFDLRHRSLVM